MLLLKFSADAQITKLATNKDLAGFVTVDGSKCIMNDFGGNVYTTNGTAAGTKKFTTKVLAGFYYTNHIDYNGYVIFSAYSGDKGYELWKTDGTDAGTVLVKDISPTELNNVNTPPTSFVAFKSKIYFFASTPETGYELWVTDGTEAGTTMVKDINPGTGSSFVTDGTKYAFFTSDTALTSINATSLFFTANDGTHGNELWKTDGTAAGTKLVKDINAGTAGSDAALATVLGTQIIFLATDATHGTELWKTDGTTTAIVKDLTPGKDSTSITSFLPFKSKLYFAYDDGTHGPELWSTDGTSAGTALVKDIDPGAGGSYPELSESVVFNNKFLVRITTYDVSQQGEYWVSDGTAAGTTKLMSDFISGSICVDHYDKNSNNLFVNHNPPYNGKVFLYAAKSAAYSGGIYITDGTTVTPVKDSFNVNYGYYYTPAALHFIGVGKSGKYQFLKTNGTAAGTKAYATLPFSSNNINGYNFQFNGKLYLHNDDGDNTGNYSDLYVTSQSVLPLSLINFTAQKVKLNVQLAWQTSQEVNTSYFAVEKSSNGISFNTFQTVTANGSSNTIQFYSATDANPYTGTSWYRLKMVDKDGRFAYSSTIPVTYSVNSLLTVNPNPVTDRLNIWLQAGSNSKSTLQLTDINGRVLLSKQLSLTSGANSLSIPVGQYAKGTYLLVIVQGDDKQSLEWIKR